MDTEKQNMIYCALFVSPERLKGALSEIARQPLDKEISLPHVTLAFRPKDYRPELLGESAVIEICGYGCDGRNEGLLVRVRSGSETIRQMADKLACPHITLSLSPEGRAADTGRLAFRPVRAVPLPARYGIFCADGSVAYGPEQG